MMTPEIRVDRFRHEAMLYAGIDQFLDRTVAFIRDGVSAGEPTLVVVSDSKIAALSRRLGSDAAAVQFADMAAVGANPARIIPAWRDFVDRHKGTGRRLRGIGEPIYPERPESVLVECVRHEALLNVAFDGDAAWWLLCPYDVTALPAAVIEEAHRTHPYVAEGGKHVESAHYPGLAASGAPFQLPLPEPAAVEAMLAFDAGKLTAARRLVSRQAARAGFMSAPIDDFVRAVNEVATNSVMHGGGSGTLRLWRDGDSMVCEVRDTGKLNDPLADRRKPHPDRDGGRGLWLANQLCDLVQIRSLPLGTVVRLHMQRDRTR